MQIGIQSSIDAVVRDLGVAERQARWAAVVAINRTLPLIREELRQQMRRSFDRPTPYTLNSLRSEQATRQSLAGRVALRDEGSAGKGTPATKYLAPQVSGGTRSLKRLERALRWAGVLRNGYYAVPAAGARLDQYGNISRGQIVQMLSYLRAFNETGFTMNRAAHQSAGRGRNRKPRHAHAYFAVRWRENRLAPGIYMRRSTRPGERGIVPVLAFVDGAPSYTARLDFHGAGERVARNAFPRIYAQALADTLATSGTRGRWTPRSAS